MKLNREGAEKVWKAYFGNVSEAVDAFGRRILRTHHGNDGQYSWEIDHVWPRNPASGAGGANTYSNVQPLHSQSNAEKSNSKRGRINGREFRIDKIDNHEHLVIGRMAYVGNNGEWYWSYSKPKYQ